MLCNATSNYSLFGNPGLLLGKSNLCAKYKTSFVSFYMTKDQTIRRGFFFLLVLTIGRVILLWHSLGFP